MPGRAAREYPMTDESPEIRLEALIARMTQRRAETEEIIRSLEERERPVELDQTLQGRVSRIDAITQQQMARASKGHLKTELERIDAALARAARGRYGICCRCELPIEPARLLADPTAAFCIDCLDEIAEEQRSQQRPR
jgi:DnaK suppressor protein